ncbi:hypothetical protein BT96DRAFT_994722 [Gymnopus androsaceus JB14]|uniref:Uncharacterized protein n=1 Tax=Gymnopus androsaceus JB14 TaxID=1447944 RepID=A0A6A4HPD3_9AGAR|nr:hypothetical protein BT96DRAFT_994722 [Gymnopus androsaceus JB14]
MSSTAAPERSTTIIFSVPVCNLIFSFVFSFIHNSNDIFAMATHLGELASSSPPSTPKLITSASSEFIDWTPSQEQWGIDLEDDVALLRNVFGVYPASPFTPLQPRISTLNCQSLPSPSTSMSSISSCSLVSSPTPASSAASLPTLPAPVAASVASTPVISLPAAPSSTFKCARKGCSLKSNSQHCTTGLCTKDCQARPDLNCLYHHRQAKKQGQNRTVPALSMLPLVGPIELSSAALSSSVSSSGIAGNVNKKECVAGNAPYAPGRMGHWGHIGAYWGINAPKEMHPDSHSRR